MTDLSDVHCTVYLIFLNIRSFSLSWCIAASWSIMFCLIKWSIKYFKLILYKWISKLCIFFLMEIMHIQQYFYLRGNAQAFLPDSCRLLTRSLLPNLGFRCGRFQSASSIVAEQREQWRDRPPRHLGPIVGGQQKPSGEMAYNDKLAFTLVRLLGVSESTLFSLSYSANDVGRVHR
jgi:hypothetical protein